MSNHGQEGGPEEVAAAGAISTGRSPGFLIDGLQFCNWSKGIFRQMREGDVDAVHATVVYHGTFRDAVREIASWNRLYLEFEDLICRGLSSEDVVAARSTGKTAILLGFQNPSPIEDDIDLVDVLHALGIRFMQLSYNNQSLLASGWMESGDTGITRMGREVIREMNRVGMAVDMSHSGERSTLEAIAHSEFPVAVTHANPDWWRPTARNKSDHVIQELARSDGMLGFSLYPQHLRNGSNCTLEEFCSMVAEVAQRHGTHFIGIGSDLCQDRPASALAWMRNGRWAGRSGDTAALNEGFPAQPSWFQDNRDFGGLAKGLGAAGFDGTEIAAILGGNWFRYLRRVLDRTAEVQ